MKKLFKILLFIIPNILFLLLCLFVCDFIIYKINSVPEFYYKHHGSIAKIPPFKYYPKGANTTFINLDKSYYCDGDNQFAGRKPVGTQYKTEPIILFGDSYIHGQYLEPTQNFGYKLSQALKRPVYNRGIQGSCMQHMLHQVTEPTEDFFETVPPSDTVYYLFIEPHWQRLTIMSDFDALGGSFYLRYKLKNGKLVKDNYNNIPLNLIKSSYTIRVLNLHFLDKYLVDPKNADKLTDYALAYLKETRDILEKIWNKKIKFNVIFYCYNPIPHKDLFKKKLKENGFNVIDTDELTDIDLKSEDYMFQDNLHPKEKAWDVLTPLIIKHSQL